MELSVFLARVLGLYLLIVGIAVILQRKEMGKVIDDFADTPVLLLFSNSLSVLFGLLIVIGHPYWGLDWRVLITLLGYFTLLRGLVGLYYPSQQIKFARWIVARDGLLYISGLWIVIGLFLFYHGFKVSI